MYIDQKIIQFLETEYEQKRSINPRYSMSAFAKWLELPVSSLHRIMKGERKVSAKLIEQIKLKFKLDEKQFKKILGLEHEKASIENFLQLEEDQFKLISEWFHFAIYSLTLHQNFKNDHNWIAKQLGLRKYQVDEAIKRMMNLGMLEIGKNGKYQAAKGNVNVSKPNANSIKKHQLSLLEKAYKSVSQSKYEHRAHSTLTLAVNRKGMDLVRQKMDNFKAELEEIINTNFPEKDDVYHLTMSYFPAKEA